MGPNIVSSTIALAIQLGMAVRQLQLARDRLFAFRSVLQSGKLRDERQPFLTGISPATLQLLR